MCKHEMNVEAGGSEQELRSLFPDTPVSRFTIDVKNGVVTCWDRHKVGEYLLEDNGVKIKIKQGGKITFQRAKQLLGETFTDMRGVKRLIPSWEGLKSSFLCLPQA